MSFSTVLLIEVDFTDVRKLSVKILIVSRKFYPRQDNALHRPSLGLMSI